MYGQWLYLEIAYVWTMVISGHSLSMDSGFIKTLYMYGQWLYLDMFNVWTVVI